MILRLLLPVSLSAFFQRVAAIAPADVIVPPVDDLKELRRMRGLIVWERQPLDNLVFMDDRRRPR